MTDYEIRKIDRPIEESPAVTELSENNNMETDSQMIHETEAQAIARAQHWDDVSDSITVAQSRLPRQQQLDKQRQAHQDRLAAGALEYALQCKSEFDPVAVRAQFESECG